MYGQLFRQADTEAVGVVTGEIAVKFFEKTRLDSRVLGEVSPTTTGFYHDGQFDLFSVWNHR